MRRPSMDTGRREFWEIHIWQKVTIVNKKT